MNTTIETSNVNRSQSSPSDKGKGFTIFANAEQSAVLLNSYISQLLLKEMNFSGVDFSKFVSRFESQAMQPEEPVNQGYKQLIFDSFLWPKAEKLAGLEKDPLEGYNILQGATILAVSNDKFARAENLFSDYWYFHVLR